MVRDCQVIAGSERMGMIGFQGAHPVGDHLLEHGDGVVETACSLIGKREVVAGGECLGVVGA